MRCGNENKMLLIVVLLFQLEPTHDYYFFLLRIRVITYLQISTEVAFSQIV